MRPVGGYRGDQSSGTSRLAPGNTTETLSAETSHSWINESAVQRAIAIDTVSETVIFPFQCAASSGNVLSDVQLQSASFQPTKRR